jgi:BirA family biotin operon repressor/biotin-[acetyl-CoA-carboxylase] ligase
MNREAADWEGWSVEELRARWHRHVHLYGLADSTNTRAKDLAKSGAVSGTVVVADAQAAGRGIASRRWHSPAGSGLYLSLILRPERVPNARLIPLLAGLGAARAAERTTTGVRVELKWPNDLIVNDRKVGGVLVEGSWTAGVPAWLVIGVGINVHLQAADFPDVLQSVATSLDSAARRRVSRLALADSLIDELETTCGALPQRLDQQRLQQIARRDWLLNRPCVLEASGGETLSGVAHGIGPDGALTFSPEAGSPVAVSVGRIRTDRLLTPEY